MGRTSSLPMQAVHSSSLPFVHGQRAHSPHAAIALACAAGRELLAGAAAGGAGGYLLEHAQRGAHCLHHLACAIASRAGAGGSAWLDTAAAACGAILQPADLNLLAAAEHRLCEVEPQIIPLVIARNRPVSRPSRTTHAAAGRYEGGQLVGWKRQGQSDDKHSTGNWQTEVKKKHLNMRQRGRQRQNMRTRSHPCRPCRRQRKSQRCQRGCCRHEKETVAPKMSNKQQSVAWVHNPCATACMSSNACSG